MLLAILLMLCAPSAPLQGTDDAFVQEAQTSSISQLRASLESAQGIEKGVALLFLAATDTVPNKWSESAHRSLDTLYNARKTPLRAVLLGTVEAMRARDSQKDEIQATLWLGRSFRHLDEGVAGDPGNMLLRIFRINSLVDVPEMFHVDARLKEDRDVLRAQTNGDVKKADVSTLMALAAVSWREGKSREAIAMWRLVVARERKGSPDRQAALRKLERARG